LLRDDFDAAIADCSEAIRLDPKYVNAYCNRGAAYGNKREYDNAIADYNEAIDLDPNEANAYCNRGAVYGEKREWNKAIADLTEAIRLNPKYVGAYFQRGCAYMGRGCPSGGGLVRAFAWGFLGRGKDDFNRAITDLTEAVRLKPDCAEAYYCRGVALKGKGEKSKAEADFAEAKRLGFKPE
jgi:tetratricopeptide (TPR) repeat protein